MMDYLIGLDIGTSSIKGVLFTTDGCVAYSVKEVFCYKKMGNGEVELDPNQYLTACYCAIKELAQRATDGAIKGVCASSASGNLLLLDKENKPLTNIISWQDKRVSDEAKEVLGEMDDDAFYRSIGWRFRYKAFPLAQLCYIKKHNSHLMRDCGKVAMSTEYLYYTLTGKWGISTSAGTTYFLIDQQKGEYIKPILNKIGVTEEQLPPIMPCGSVLGTVNENMEDLCGLPKGTPVILGSFDHPSAARGVGVLNEGQILLSCGTSWVAFFPIGNREKGANAGMLIDPFLSPSGCYGVMTSVASLSERIRLYVNRYIDDSKDAFGKLSALARQSVSGANGLCINPQDDPDDERILAFSKEHIARAIMEGTVRLLKERLDGLAEKGISANKAIMVGGPSEDPYWITLIEEMCGIAVDVQHGSFAGAVGAAMIAGIGVGTYEDEEDAILKRNERKGE